MAYDFGSQTLGIKNPFKKEGLFKAVAGVLVALLGIFTLIQVASELKADKVVGWAYVIIGFYLLISGVRHTSVGFIQLFRYFVGRSVPTSLAENKSPSEQESAKYERNALQYDAKTLYSMMMGRKNTTFTEPVGFLGRFVHSIFPKLTFLPHPLRMMAQEIAGMVINYLTGIVSFLIVFFIVTAGLAGETAALFAMPIVGTLLLLYLVISWSSAARAIQRTSQTVLKSSGGASFGVIIAASIMIPIVAGVYLDEWLIVSDNTQQIFTEASGIFNAWANLGLLTIATLVVLAAVLPLLFARMANASPQTEVSEYRENMQESVHPNEVFINIENIVLANRRYKEMPNRIYREFDPKLIEQSDGKGSFNGQLLIETQPALAEEENNSKQDNKKTILSTIGQIAFVISAIAFYYLGQNIISAIGAFDSWKLATTNSNLTFFLQALSSALFTLFAWLTFKSAAKILDAASHLFWGEMHFTSLLMHLNTEGTYTESKLSTGMSIHDSTRSENTVVRSSITPWIITTRIKTSIFATSGMKNLEQPRYIMSMAKNDQELDSIVDEIKSFLKEREAIAAITNERDLSNASQIHQINQQSRAFEPNVNVDAKLSFDEDEQAAGYLRNEAAQESVEKDANK
ncbi:hypothetical protein [Brumicola pallidula]|jgi:hypothetical protein|uniref:Uncharacterized protein n=1 Tax=Brumicola pallidula DSM 14239 = ACAM 615 TaxID=1121922 RepID=K6YAF1_9ALTE|nr:hypothetical protein [Glaciecola pallidula]GAC29724.1 hypothetical protein GPAL_2873 [Glaciecola pallidula DSM 14239 = ACAM 615]